MNLEHYLAGLLQGEVTEASLNKAIDTCIDINSKFMAQAPALIEKANNSIKQSGLTKSSSTSKSNHSHALRLEIMKVA